MVIASSAGAPPPAWLDTLGTVAGVLLAIELVILLIVVLALVAGLAYGVWWVHKNVVPVVQENTPRVERAMAVTDRSADRVVRGVAEFYGRRQAVETSLRVFLFGRGQARQVYNEATVRAATDLQVIDASAATEQSLTGPENGFTPRLNVADDADVRPTVRTTQAQRDEGADRSRRNRDERHDDDNHQQIAGAAG